MITGGEVTMKIVSLIRLFVQDDAELRTQHGSTLLADILNNRGFWIKCVRGNAFWDKIIQLKQNIHVCDASLCAINTSVSTYML